MKKIDQPDTETQLYPREIETKIVNLGSKEEFLRRLERAGATLVKDRRLLETINYKMTPKTVHDFVQVIAVKLAALRDPKRDRTKLKNMLQFFGLEIISESDDAFSVRAVPNATDRTTRIRRDGKITTWTLKEKRTENATVDDRIELEVELSDPSVIEGLHGALGYLRASKRQKYRTSYKFGDALIELNESPVAPPWAEIEGKDAEHIIAIAQQLGYTKDDLAPISEAKYFESHGVTPEQSNNLVFEEEK